MKNKMQKFAPISAVVTRLIKDGIIGEYKKGGYLKDKNTYVTKDGKETKRGLWSNVYLKKKREGKLKNGGSIDLSDVVDNITFGIMNQGGSISGFKQYDAPTHEDGGAPINEDGTITTNNQVGEIEGTENTYTYQNLPNKQQESYVFSDANETSPKLASIIKKYKKDTSNPDLDEPTRTAMEMEIKGVEAYNEAINSIKAAVEETIQMKYGGSTKKYNNGGNIARDYYDGVPQSNPINPSIDFSVLDNIDAGRVLSTGLNLINARNLFAKPEQEEVVTPDYTQADMRINQLDYNLDQARQDSEAVSNVSSNLNRNAVSSYSAFRTREAQNLANLQDNLANIGLQEQNVRNNILSTQAQYETNKARDIADRITYTNEINAMNRARTQDVQQATINTFMQEADRISQQNNINNLANASIEEGKLILNNMFPDFNIDDNTVNELIKLSKGEITKEELSEQSLDILKFNS